MGVTPCEFATDRSPRRCCSPFASWPRHESAPRATTGTTAESCCAMRFRSASWSLHARCGSTPRRAPIPTRCTWASRYTNHTAPDNYWNLYTGTYRPGANLATNAVWDWDNTVGIQAADSLQGWWPLRRQYNSSGGLTLTDDLRPWWAIDHGNLANYVISQQSSAKRTFGVVGHLARGRRQERRYCGAVVTALGYPVGVVWSTSARRLSATDAVTGSGVQPGHRAVPARRAAGSNTGSMQGFPGYPDQIDQILYRDIAMLSSQSLTVSFKYRTRMSTSINTAAATRTGWFHGDPLAVTAGNFISSSAAGANAPQDSFMVYIGSAGGRRSLSVLGRDDPRGVRQAAPLVLRGHPRVRSGRPLLRDLPDDRRQPERTRWPRPRRRDRS